MMIVGIDPGKNGGICVLKSGRMILLSKTPETPMGMLVLMRKIAGLSKGDCVCYLEKVGGMPGNGGSAMFNFGQTYGLTVMALLATNIKTVTVTPQKWQKFFQLGTKSACASNTIWKNKLKAKAEQLFPEKKLFLWGSDAVLIAEYANSIEREADRTRV